MCIVLDLKFAFQDVYETGLLRRYVPEENKQREIVGSLVSDNVGYFSYITCHCINQTRWSYDVKNDLGAVHKLRHHILEGSGPYT